MERERLQAALAQRQAASAAYDTAAPDASVDAILEAVRELQILCRTHDSLY